jgi:hypothetical protein
MKAMGRYLWLILRLGLNPPSIFLNEAFADTAPPNWTRNEPEIFGLNLSMARREVIDHIAQHFHIRKTEDLRYNS